MPHEVEDALTSWTKRGKCPRCNARIFRTLTGGIVLKDLEDPRVAFYCNCGFEHPGRPATEELGCGRKAWVDRPKSD